MGHASKITQQSDDVRASIDAWLIKHGFTGYEQLEADLAERGISIGKSSLHRYGSKLERRLAAIKASTEAARMIANAAPDDAGQREAAVISLIQTEVFETLIHLQEAETAEDPVQRAKILSSVAKNVATLTRASIAQKRHEDQVRAKVSAAADAVARLAKKGGMSDEAVEEARRHVMGIAD